MEPWAPLWLKPFCATVTALSSGTAPPPRPSPLVQHRAHTAATCAEAISASPVIVVCLLDYPAVQETFAPAADRLRGRTIVRPDLLAPLLQYFETWTAAGHGAEDISGVVELIAANAPDEATAPRSR